MVNVSERRVLTWKLTELVWLLFGLLEALIAWAMVQLIWIVIDRPRSTTVVRETTVVDQTIPSHPQRQARL